MKKTGLKIKNKELTKKVNVFLLQTDSHTLSNLGERNNLYKLREIFSQGKLGQMDMWELLQKDPSLLIKECHGLGKERAKLLQLLIGKSSNFSSYKDQPFMKKM